jgi:hypothetical protein
MVTAPVVVITPISEVEMVTIPVVVKVKNTSYCHSNEVIIPAIVIAIK